MPQTLLLRLPSPGQEETEWLTIDDAGDSETTRQRGSLTLAAAVSRTGKVVALAPATQILLAEPELPPGSGVKLARAVPFALEEHLTEDIDQLSFADRPAPPRRRHAGGRGIARRPAGLDIGPERRRPRAAGHVPGHLADAGKPRSNGAVAGEGTARRAASRERCRSRWSSRR